MVDEEISKWVPYSSKKEDDSPKANSISYADAADHQKTEFGPIPGQR